MLFQEGLINQQISMSDKKASQDLRKHALEALERRCAAAKVELLQQQKISSTEKSKKEVKGKSALNDPTSVVSRNQYNSSITLPSEGKPPNKGPLIVDMVFNIFVWWGRQYVFSLLMFS